MSSTPTMPTRIATQPPAELAASLSPASVIRCEEPMAKHTTLRVGGPAEIYIEPASEDELATVVKFAAARNVPWVVIGRGSNLLVRDGGIRGIVICLCHPHFSGIEVSGMRLRCGAGAKLKAVANEAKRLGIAGFEFLEGIPGSVGGALRMNAGAMDAATFDLVEFVRVMDVSGAIREMAPREMAVAYRSCDTLKAQIALGAVLKGKPDTREAVEQRMNAFNRKRWASQPAAPSAGCIFKNPTTVPAGKLIDELGLKGVRAGGAVVSAEHGNFIVNEGRATAREVLELIEVIKRRARSERGIDLQTEVEILGVD